MIQTIKNNLHILVLIISPIYSFLWHFENNHLPMSDAVGFLESAYIISQNFLNGNYIDFLISIFNERSWRPVIFQLYIVPFLIITNGDLLNSVLLTHVLFTSLSVFFTYKIFIKFSGKFLSSISASIICLSVDIFFGGESFPLFAEISFIPFLLGTFYFLSDSDLFKKKSSTSLFALFFTLTLLSRPVEGFLFLSVALILLVCFRHSKYLSYQEILTGFTYPLLFSWILFASRLVPNVSSSVIKVNPPHSYELFFNIFCIITFLLVLILIINFLSRYKKNLNNLASYYFSKSMLYSSLILWFWYTPRFGSLYGWVYDTSVGTQFSHQKGNVFEVLDLINMAFISHGSVTIYLLIFLLLISVVFRVFQDNDNLKKKYNDISLIIISSCAIPIFLYLTTFQISYRKIAPVVTLFLILALIKIISNYKIKKISYVFLSTILLTKIYFMTDNIFSFNENDKWVNQGRSTNSVYFIGSQLPTPINSDINFHYRLVSFISEQAKTNNLKEIALVLDDAAYPAEPYLTKLLCFKISLECTFSSPKKYKQGDITYLNSSDALLIVYRSENENILKNDRVDIIKEKIDARINTSSPSELYSYYLYYLYEKNGLNIHEINTVKCKHIHNKYNACLLIKD